MPAPAPTKPKMHYMRLVVIQALLITLLAHGVMLFLFRYDPRPVKAATERRPGIKLFNLNSNSPERRERIMTWMDRNDPSIIARADSPHSPVARLRPAERPAVPKAVAPRADSRLPERQVTAPVALAPPPSAIETVPFVTAEEAATPSPGQFPQFWVNGRLVAIEVPEEIRSLGRAVHATTTEIEMRRPSVEAPFSGGRFLLTRSSGSTRLDMWAVRTLSGELDSLAGPGKTLKVIIRWQRPPVTAKSEAAQ